MTNAEPALTIVVQAQVKFRRGNQVIALTSSLIFTGTKLSLS